MLINLVSLSLSSQTPAKVELSEDDPKRVRFEQASGLRYKYPDSSMLLLEQCLQVFMDQKDTLNAIYTLREQARGYGHQAYYKDSYDKLWTALLLADEARLDKATAFLYIDLGRYYSFYKRREKALEYFGHSLRVNRKIVVQNQLDEGVLADNYYAYGSTYRELGEIELAKQYLDSCFLYHSTKHSDINLAYLNFEKAFLLKEDKKYDQALILFESVLPWLEENDPGYQVLVNSYMGDTYREKGNFEKSEECYKKALNASKTFNSHKDFTPLVHEKLSELYYWKGDLEAAFLSLQTVKALDELYFDSRSHNNRPLLEILDSFRNEKEAQRKLLQEQRLAQLEHEERVLFLQKTILLVSLFFLMIIGFIYFAYVRAKHKAEKQLIKKQKELEVQKANEIVELKNKELSASTLKLIAKDEFILNLKEKISQKDSDVKVRDIKRIINTAVVGND
ncbi:MAG: hypothetical protein AAF705_09105, partial [Bacteroidota bacterium]